MFSPALYSQLQCDCIRDTAEHSTEQSACTESSSSYLIGISQHTRPLVKKNNAEFTNVSSFTSLLVCSVHFTLSCRTLLAFPTSNSFVQCICFEIPVQSAWGYCLGPLGVGYFSGRNSSSELDSFGFRASDISDLAASCRKFLFVFCIQKCTAGCTV